MRKNKYYLTYIDVNKTGITYHVVDQFTSQQKGIKATRDFIKKEKHTYIFLADSEAVVYPKYLYYNLEVSSLLKGDWLDGSVR